ncbi:MAG: hypothetical protein E6J84_13580, partial [Deltaproteobacteria bacterium]
MQVEAEIARLEAVQRSARKRRPRADGQRPLRCTRDGWRIDFRRQPQIVVEAQLPGLHYVQMRRRRRQGGEAQQARWAMSDERQRPVLARRR